jgi:DNA helicase IV
VSTEVAREQTYISMLYGRLDSMRETATDRLNATKRGSEQGGTAGGTMQARGERDSAFTMYLDQIAQYNAVENGLCFGRLDFAEGRPLYVGRIGIHSHTSDDDVPYLMDWRAPAARPFYLATVASPEGLTRRRHIQTHRREVLGVEDEAFDLDAVDADTHDTLTNENALLAAMNANRTGQMGDIVETIQVEQDQIIRSGHDGILVVQGGPGTGKTAVALHRAAYLLYTHRAELVHRAVLIVGPSTTFLRYIGRVLPGLGESAVVLTTIGTLLPGIAATATETPEAAEVKGRPEMAGVVLAAIRDRQQVPDEPWEVPFDRDVVRFDRALVEPIRDRMRRSRMSHNQAHPIFVEEMVAALARQVADRIGADVLGGPNLLTAGDIATFRDEIREDPSVMDSIAELWPILTAEQLIADLYTESDRLESAAPKLSDGERALLARAVGDAWTAADIPLLDEAAELLGTDDSAQVEADERVRGSDTAYAEGVLEILSRDIEDDEEILMAYDLIDAGRLAGRQVESDGLSVAERAAADRQWAYGHIIVDEAQELSAMAWRALMRRCPSRSMTLVGDIAQTSDLAGTSAWDTALSPFVEDRWRIAELTVNYRTPSEIMDVAADVLAKIDPELRVPRSVRSSGHPPVTVTVPRPDLGDRLAGLVAAVADEVGDGRLAVLVADKDFDLVRATLPDAAAGEDPDLTHRLVVLDVRQAKGLEFDAAIVVDPDRIVGESARGLNDLYVALTRATKRLVIITTT